MNRMIAAGAIALAVVTAACGVREGPASAGGPGSEVPVAKVVCPAAVVHDKVQYPDAPSSTMVPAGSTGGTACRYQNSFEPKPNTLAKSVSLTAAQTTALATALNGARVWPPGTVFNCPIDVGGADLVIFDYADRGPVEVLIDATGCVSASNGHRTAMGAGVALDQLTPLVGAGPRS